MNEIPMLTNDSGWLVIWNDIKTFGAGFWAFFILISFYILKDQIKDLIKVFIQKITFSTTKKAHYTKKDLLKHPIFQDLDYWLDIGLKALKIKISPTHHEDEDYTQSKEDIAKEVIRIKYTTIKESLTNFVNETDIDNIDNDVACMYFIDCLTKNLVTQKKRMLERGIPLKFLNKFHATSDITEKIVIASAKSFFNRGCDLTASTKIYFMFNTLNGYLNIIFNNITEAIESINGDLKGEYFDGKPMCSSFKKQLNPPHPTYTLIVKEKLDEVLRDFYGSRAFICKYFKKDGVNYHSAVYESTIKGVTSEIHNIQMISDDKDKNMLTIMKESGCIAADISKFGATTIERFNTRGVKGIFICPIYNNQKIDGVLCVDFISIEKFNMAINDHDLDEKLQKYAQSFAPYIIYPDGYKF